MELLEILVEIIILEVIEKCIIFLFDDYDEKYGVFLLEELGFDIDGLFFVVWLGGEIEVFICLERYLERKVWVVNFERF